MFITEIAVALAIVGLIWFVVSIQNGDFRNSTWNKLTLLVIISHLALSWISAFIAETVKISINFV